MSLDGEAVAVQALGRIIYPSKKKGAAFQCGNWLSGRRPSRVV